jgi:L-asparagine transporter-like permease
MENRKNYRILIIWLIILLCAISLTIYLPIAWQNQPSELWLKVVGTIIIIIVDVLVGFFFVVIIRMLFHSKKDQPIKNENQ